jgi:hypothetical protein
MAQQLSVANPFGLMMNPEAVFQAVERSALLGRLQRRVCRPLDKPLIPKQGQAELAAFDSEIDLAEDVSGEE